MNTGRMAELIYPDGLTLYGTFPRFAVSQDSLVDVGVPDGYTMKTIDRNGADRIEQREK
jgi:hypothetical protein